MPWRSIKAHSDQLQDGMQEWYTLLKIYTINDIHY